MKYCVIGSKNGKEVGRLSMFAASASKSDLLLDALTLLADAGFDCDSAKVETFGCPTCKTNQWAEIYPSNTDPTGFTLYCRRCEEGCVSPLLT